MSTYILSPNDSVSDRGPVEMMKAYVFDVQAKTVHLNSVPKPIIGPNEVLVKIIRFSICRTDISMLYSSTGEDPTGEIPCHEVLGEVVQSNDPRFQLGDHLVYWGDTDFGGAAEYRKMKPILPEDPIQGEAGTSTQWRWVESRLFYDVAGPIVVKVDPNRKDLLENITMLEILAGVLRPLEKYRPEQGKNAIVLGAGPVGMLAVQSLLKVYKVGQVMVFDIDENKLKNLEKTDPENIKTIHLKPPKKLEVNAYQLLIDEYPQLVELITKYQGAFATYLFDALPPLENKEYSIPTRFIGMNFLSPDGRYILYSASADMREPTSGFLMPPLIKGIHFLAAGYDQRHFPMPVSAAIMQKAYNLIADGTIDLAPLVTGRINFLDESAVQAAFKNYGGPTHACKTVVEVVSQ